MRLKIFVPLVGLLAALALGAGGFALQQRGAVDEQRRAADEATSEVRDLERSLDALEAAIEGSFDVPAE